VGIDDNFFDLGGNSLLSISCVAQLETRGLKLPIVKLYQHPTIRACATYLEGGTNGRSPAEMAKLPRQGVRKGADREEIAIIGMSGRFPGAGECGATVEEPAGEKEQHQHLETTRPRPSIPEELRNDPDYVKPLVA
jgi:aryl carrier-like protein